MKYRATYIHRRSPDQYFRELWADSLSEATKQAEKWVRKNYMLLKVVQV